MRHLIRSAVVALALLFVASPVVAQSVSVRVDAYLVTTSTTSAGNLVVPIAEVTCNQDPTAAGASTVNPTHVEYTDDANTGKVCRLNVATLVDALAAGTYTARARIVYADGHSGAQSPHSTTFTRVESVPAGVRVIKP